VNLRKYIIVGLFSFLVVFVQENIAQSVFESGQLAIRNFPSSEYNALPQILAITQDDRGVMYFGNRTGILEYDGIYWREIKLKNQGLVRSLHKSTSGLIFVGGNDELGYLSPDGQGSLAYVSIVEKLKEQHQSFGDVWHILETSEGLFFQTSPYIFCS